MKKSIILILLIFFYQLTLFAQKEGNIWYFGSKAGLDFNSGVPVALNNSAMNASSGCATISDTGGNLLFYTNGQTVWNKLHKVMFNGTGLLGHYLSTQSALITPLPGSNHLYYIFTVCQFGLPDGFRYSIVDMNQDSGRGSIIVKNVPILTPVSEKITAVRHANNKYIWVITHLFNSDAFYAYLLTPTGLNLNPVVSHVGSLHGPNIMQAVGYMKISPEGKKLAIAVKGDITNHFTEVFDFNNSTGTVSNPMQLFYDSKALFGYGVEFSSDCNILYISTSNSVNNSILQYNLGLKSPALINKSVKLIAYDTIWGWAAMQIGPDRKMYICNKYDVYIGVINNPNDTGISCNFILKAIQLKTGTGSQTGLPTFLQSYFFVPDFTAKPLCYGDSTHFSINDTNQLDSVFWNFGNPSTGINNTSTVFKPSHKFNDTGTYRVLVIVYHKGTADSSFRDLRISYPPKAIFSVNDSLQCFKSNKFIFNNNSVIQSGSMTWEWDFGDSVLAYAKDTSHSYVSDNTYNVRLVALSDFGCSDTFSKNIVVYRSPKAKFEIYDSSQCLERNNFDFINKTALFNNKFNCLWNFGDSLTSVLINPSHQYKYADTFTVALVVSDSSGCADTFTKHTLVHVHPKPLSNFIVNDSNQCLSGNNFLFNNTSTIKSGTFKQYWNFGDNNSDTNYNANHSYLKEDTFSVKLLLLSDKGCKDSVIKAVYIHSDPIAQFTINDSTQCLTSNNFVFSNKSIFPNPLTYKNLWLFGDGNSDTSTNPLHSYISTGNYPVKLLLKSAGNCSDSFTKTITVLQQPNVKYGVNDSAQCLKANLFQFSNSTTGAISYKWDFGDGNSDTSQNPNHIYLSTGIFNTKLISQSAGGCSDTSNLTLTVLEVPKVAFSVNDTSQLLSGNSFIFSNLTNCKPASSTCKYMWDFGDSKSDTLSNPTHNYSAVGKYNVLLTSTSTNGCKDTVGLLVNVFNIIVNTAFTVKDVCLGDYAFFKNSSTIQFDSFLNFLWDFGDGNTIVRPNPQHLYADTGIYKVQLISLSYGGYRDTTNGKVRVLPAPTVEIIATPDSILEQGIKATLSVNGFFDSLLWSTGAITVSIEVDKAGIYSIRVVDVNGCNAVDKINIEYLPEKPFKTMNVITPNGDGINDYWKVFNIEKYKPCKLAIYNRWGDELFSTSDYHNNWDGTYKGKHLPEGTYYFVLETKDGKVYKGAVNILR
jgi:gliding motility-associated-like protein